jgi:hypothetical protein
MIKVDLQEDGHWTGYKGESMYYCLDAVVSGLSCKLSRSSDHEIWSPANVIHMMCSSHA